MSKTLMATASAFALLVAMPTGFAQTTPGQTPPATTTPQPRAQTQPSTPPTGAAGATTQAPGQVDAQRLIGRNVTNAQNETVGEIESLMVDQDGKIRTAILGIGGFLGIGERHVAVNWDQLSVAPNGDRVTVNMTREQARALPEFRYSETQRRGSVFTDTSTSRTTNGTTAGRTTGTTGTTTPGTAPRTGAMSGSGDTSGTVGTTRPGATAPQGATGNMAMTTPGAAGTTAGNQPLSASNLIGLNLRNTANESIGEVKDIIVGADGKVSEVIVGVGGFLGMGERYVAISWDQLRMSRTNDARVQGEVGYTRDQLREMPTWRQDRTGWVRG